MRIIETAIPGCFEILPEVLRDERGYFVKTFHEGLFHQYSLETRFAESYHTWSRQGVLRGLHFQIPPMDHVKLVSCALGAVIDAVVDLRKGSPTEGKHITVRLNAEQANMLYLPRGLAHGFYVTSSEALVLYRVSTVYSPKHDEGILWDSAGIPWPTTSPMLSVRDRALPRLEDFKTPFAYEHL